DLTERRGIEEAPLAEHVQRAVRHHRSREHDPARHSLTDAREQTRDVAARALDLVTLVDHHEVRVVALYGAHHHVGHRAGPHGSTRLEGVEVDDLDDESRPLATQSIWAVQWVDAVRSPCLQRPRAVSVHPASAVRRVVESATLGPLAAGERSRERLPATGG